jgi:hypothetical protein
MFGNEKVNLKAFYIYIYIYIYIIYLFVFSSFNMKPHETSVTKNIFPYQRYLGGGEGFYIRLWCGGRRMRSDRHSFSSDSCDALWRSGPGLYTWPVRQPWWSRCGSFMGGCRIDLAETVNGSEWIGLDKRTHRRSELI